MKLRFLFAILLAITSSFALACVESSIGNLLRGETSFYLGVAFMTVVLIISLSYAYSTVTHNAHASLFSKEELFHVLISVLLVIGIGGFMYFGCSIFASVLDYSFSAPLLNVQASSIPSSNCYSSSDSPQTLALCYLTKTRDRAYSYVNLAMEKNIQNEMGSTASVGVVIPVLGSTTVPLSSWKKAFAAQYETMSMSFAMPALISLNLQVLFLTMNLQLIQFLIPAALILRVLPGTRMFGNMLIALCIVLYVIVPFLYALNGAMDDLVFRDYYFCQKYAGAVYDQYLDSDVAAPLTSCDSQTGYFALARLMPHAFFLPNLVLAIAITFLSGIAKALKVIG